MKKLLAILAVFAMVMTGCTTDGTVDSGDQGTSTPEATGDVVVQVGAENYQIAYFEAIAEEYEALNEGVTIEVVEAGMFDILDNLETQKGNSVDVFMMPNDRIGDLADKKLIVPTSADLSEYSEVAQSAVTYKDEQYTVPMSVETTILFYNKDLVDAAPATLKELDVNTWAAKLTDFYFGAGFFVSNGAYIFGDNNTNTSDVGLNNEGAIKAGTAAQELYNSGVDQWEALKEEIAGYELMTQNFKDGNLTYVVDGPWKIAEYQDAGMNLGFAPIPSWDGTGDYQPLSGTKGMAVNAYSAELEAAMAFQEYLASAENAQKWVEITAEVNPHNSITYEAGSASETIYNAVNNSTPMPTDNAFGKVWAPMGYAVKQIVNGADPKEALDAAVDTINADIAAMN